jgi:sialic acid synthase SpsE
LYLDIFGSKSLNLAEKMNIKAVKLHGTDITNHDLLQKVASSQIQVVVLGAGGAFLDEIESALKILANKQIIIMLGFQGYPTHTDENQISRIGLLRNRYFKNFSNISIGFADHVENNATLSCSLSALAIGMGATMIEKHLTLGCVMEMEDYESALNPDEFERFVDVIRNSYSALGVTSLSNDFGMCEAETNYRNKIRRHVVASKDLIAGQVINFADLTLKRTSSTKSVNDINVIHGKKTTRFLEKNRPITLADISD